MDRSDVNHEGVTGRQVYINYIIDNRKSKGRTRIHDTHGSSGTTTHTLRIQVDVSMYIHTEEVLSDRI